MDRKPKKIYSSFEEIELDLQILKLEREIYAQKIKMSIRKTGDNLRPMNLLQDYIGNTNQTTFSFIEHAVKFILQFVVKRFKD